MQILIAGLVLALALPLSLRAQSPADLQTQVRERELAFAKTMAERDHAAFVTFISEEAIFIGRTVLRGRAAVAGGWKTFFDGPQAPFSWKPERVEVVNSGTLAISSGPVLDTAGNRVGTFNSTWQREKDGEWRVVIDVGCPPCPRP